MEENVDSDSGSPSSGGFSRTIQSFSDGKRERKGGERGRENSATAARSNVLAGTGPVSFDFRLFSLLWRNISRRKDRKARWRSLLLASSLVFFLRLGFFCFSRHVRTDREPISHYNGCSQAGSKVKLMCPALSGSKNRARAWKVGETAEGWGKKKSRRGGEQVREREE